MKEFLLETQQTISKPRDQVFKFFSNAENLEFLTPDFLNFNIFQISFFFKSNFSHFCRF